MADSEYQKRQDEDSTVFEVTPATAPRYSGAIVIGTMGILFFGLLLPLGTDHPSLFKGWAILADIVFGSLIYYGRVTDGRPKEHKSTSTFRVSSSAIESNGRTFNKDVIHRLIIKNGVTKDDLGTQMIAASSDPSMMKTGYVLRKAYERKLAAVAHSLELESGGKAYILAGGMNGTTAFGLMTDVSKIIAL
jgi:hypothetical protein